MTADELIETGRLTLAIDILSETLRRDPKHVGSRVSLFTLLGFSGQWDRAVRQLDAMSAFGAPDLAMFDPARARQLIEAERARTRYFEGGIPPELFEPAGLAVATALQVHTLVRTGEPVQARELLDRFEEEASPLRGRLGEAVFEDFRDADDLTSPILEVFAPTGYFWVEWDHVVSLDVVPPRSLLDLLWTSARLVTTSGTIGAVVLPGMYAASGSHADEVVRLGRQNDWVDLGGGLTRGFGAKVFDVGGEFKALLELQELVFDPSRNVT